VVGCSIQVLFDSQVALHRLGQFQGDQVGRIFDLLANFYFRPCFENNRSSTNFWATFSTVPVIPINFD
jgi:hypothetical protein